MSNLDLARGRTVTAPLTNQTGATRSPGDVVVLSTVNDESFVSSTSSNYSRTQIGVVDETIGIGSNGRVVVEGYARSVNVGVNTVSRGDWLYQSTTALTGTGSAIDPPLRGAFGQVLKGGTGTAPSAIILPVQYAAGSGSSSVSAGSNSMAVGATNQAGVAATFSPSDHRHQGIHTVTSSSSNTLQRPTVHLRAGSGIAFGASDTDGDGTFDTLTISSTSSGSGGSSSSGTAPDTKNTLDTLPTSAATEDDEFNDGTGFSGPVNGLNAKWTKRNLASTRLQFDNAKAPGCALFDLEASSTASQAIYQTVPAGDWTFAAKFTLHYSDARVMWGLLCVDTAGTGVIACLDTNAGSMGVRTMTTWGDGGAGTFHTGGGLPYIYSSGPHDIPIYVVLRKASGVYSMSFSNGGGRLLPGNWIEVSYTPSAFTPAYIGFGRIFGAARNLATLDWFRKVA